jgi:centromere protein I
VAKEVDKFCSLATLHGLNTDSLLTIIDLIAQQNFLDQASTTKIVKNLYPSGKVPSRAIIRIVSSLGSGETKPSLATQEVLLRWLVLTYEHIEEYSVYSKVYGILFDLLDMIGLR